MMLSTDPETHVNCRARARSGVHFSCQVSQEGKQLREGKEGCDCSSRSCWWHLHFFLLMNEEGHNHTPPPVHKRAAPSFRAGRIYSFIGWVH